VVAQAQKRSSTYSHLDLSHLFAPVAIESTTIIGPQSMGFLRDVGHHPKWERTNPSSTFYKGLSITVQRDNAASVMGTTGYSTNIFPGHFMYLIPNGFWFAIFLLFLCFII